MKRNIKLFIVGLTLFLSSSYLGAVPADPTPRTITQPDGKTLTIRLRGDEFHHFYATLDGYPLVKNSEGYMTYANKATDGTYISTNVIASEISSRSQTELTLLKTISTEKISTTSKVRAKIASKISSLVPQKSYPLTGTPKSLVILVNFSDKSFVTSSPKTAFTNLLNQAGYNTNGGTGSAKDYFQQNSRGLFNPQFDVYGPYTLSHPMAYYGGNDATGNDSLPQQMVIDACQLAYNNGVNFSTYDTDKDGILDNVFIYYAGYNEAEQAPAATIWPHRWSLNNLNTRFNGTAVYGYACTSELKGSSGASMCGIGTFCHEFGHVLGLVDLYNTDDSNAYTIADWDIMDSGPYLNSGRTPPAYSAFERYYMKWLTPTDLVDAGTYTLDTLTTSNKAYILSTTAQRSQYPATSTTYPEYFIFENRQKTGWDKYLPGHGMLITHIYYNKDNWENNSPNNTSSAMDIDIVEADGRGSIGSMSADTYPGTAAITTATLLLRSGTIIDKPIYRIQEQNGIIKFAFVKAGASLSVSKISNFKTLPQQVSAVKEVLISGEQLKANININNTNPHFEFALDSTTNSWSNTLSLTPSNYNSYSQKIYYRYYPKEFTGTTTIMDTLIVSSYDALTLRIPVTADISTKSIIRYFNNDGDLVIVTPTQNQPIYLYNMLGQLIKTVSPNGNSAIISGLPKHQILIINSGGFTSKILTQ